jgi:hypothetical protein
MLNSMVTDHPGNGDKPRGRNGNEARSGSLPKRIARKKRKTLEPQQEMEVELRAMLPRSDTGMRRSLSGMHRADGFTGPLGMTFSMGSAYCCICIFLVIIATFVIYLLARLDPNAPKEPHKAVHAYVSMLHQKVAGHIHDHFNGR